MLSRPNSFMVYCRLGVEFISFFELLHPNLKIRLQLIRARSNFHMNNDKPNISPGIVDFPFYTRRIALNDDYHMKRMDMLAYTPVEFNYLEFLAKTFIFPARQNQFLHENIFFIAPNLRIAIGMNSLYIHWTLY